MLAFIAARIPAPAEEAADRDPGFLTLVFALTRVVRREAAKAFALHCALLAQTGGPRPF